MSQAGSVVLASQSPRRHELLIAAQIAHTVRVPTVDERVLPDESPTEYVRRVAREKALAVALNPGEIILAADTSVTIDGLILGKPKGADDACTMLRLLSGNRHQVITGICLRSGDSLVVNHDTTAVWCHSLSAEEIDRYVASGEPMDKAGGYAIQGIASRFIERIEGSYSNVVGLPVALVYRELLRIRNSPF